MSEQTTILLNEFMSAGLEKEGIYRLSIDRMAVEQRTAQSGPNAGQQYKTISGVVFLVERYGEGLLPNAPREFFNAGVSGKGLQRFRDLYIAAFGAVQTSTLGADRPSVTLEDLTASVVGVDTVWTTYYWKRDRDNLETIVGSLGWSFSQDPTSLKEPKAFAERDSR